MDMLGTHPMHAWYSSDPRLPERATGAGTDMPCTSPHSVGIQQLEDAGMQFRRSAIFFSPMPLKPLDRASGQPGRWGESCTGVEISHVGDAARAAGVAPLGAAPAAAAVPAPAFETPRHPRRTLAPRLRLGAPTKLRWDPALPQHIPSADTAPITLHWDTVDNCPTTPGRTAPPCTAISTSFWTTIFRALVPSGIG